MPKLENVPQAWKHRLGAGLAYWCIHYFKVGLQEAKRVSNRVDKGLDIIRKYTILFFFFFLALPSPI